MQQLQAQTIEEHAELNAGVTLQLPLDQFCLALAWLAGHTPLAPLSAQSVKDHLQSLRVTNPTWLHGVLVLAEVSSDTFWTVYRLASVGYGQTLELAGYERLVGLLSTMLEQELPDVRCAMTQSG